MPYKRNHRKKGHKRPAKKFNKRKAKYQKAVITHMKGSGFSDSVSARLTYVEQINLNPGSVYTQYVFRGNSLFDPNYTGGGHQPLYFDQYAAIYGKYRVMGCSIRIDSVSCAGTSAAYFVCFPSTETSAFTSISQVLEQGRAKAPRILPIAQRGPTGYLKSYCSTRKVLGLTKTQVMDDDNAASVGATPIQVWYWNLLWESTDAVTNIQINGVVKLTYYVQFFDRLIATQS